MSINSDVLGGPFNGYSAKQTITSFKTYDDASVRNVLRRGWNGGQSTGTVNGYKRIITPFRAVNNSGDFLARQNYVCGGPNANGSLKPGLGRLFGSIMSNCDGTGVPASSCNVKFVADSSDYTKFRRQRAYNVTYNDINFGGYNNSAQSALPRVR